MSSLSIWTCLIVLAFGISANAAEDGIGIYEIRKDDFSVKVTNFGARIVSVVVPDRNGKLDDVVLGYDTVEAYQNDTSYFGAALGRVANRIAGAQFTLNGTVYRLPPNDGTKMIHGGAKGFSQVVWEVRKHVESGPSPYITLCYYSPDGDQGFPGALAVSVTYALHNPYKLSLTMKAEALNKATPVSLAHHAYWNLGGHNSGDILSDELQLFASQITALDISHIPNGSFTPVRNTAYDFLQPRVIKDQKAKLPAEYKGFDINYVVDGWDVRKMSKVAVVYSSKSGRVMEVAANAPGVQLYTGNYIRDKMGKCSSVYHDFSGLCLETQGLPDAVNHPNFPSQIVSVGQTYKHSILYTFSTRN